jgi:hypothetical protein
VSPNGRRVAPSSYDSANVTRETAPPPTAPGAVLGGDSDHAGPPRLDVAREVGVDRVVELEQRQREQHLMDRAGARTTHAARLEGRPAGMVSHAGARGHADRRRRPPG